MTPHDSALGGPDIRNNSYNGGAIVAEKKIFDARQQNYLQKT
jgi:hypothetical protein